MPCGFMDDLEGEVIDEGLYECGLENRLGATPRGFESLCLRQNTRGHRLVSPCVLLDGSVLRNPVRAMRARGEFAPLFAK